MNILKNTQINDISRLKKWTSAYVCSSTGDFLGKKLMKKLCVTLVPKRNKLLSLMTKVGVSMPPTLIVILKIVSLIYKHEIIVYNSTEKLRFWYTGKQVGFTSDSRGRVKVADNYMYSKRQTRSCYKRRWLCENDLIVSEEEDSILSVNKLICFKPNK